MRESVSLALSEGTFLPYHYYQCTYILSSCPYINALYTHTYTPPLIWKMQLLARSTIFRINGLHNDLTSLRVLCIAYFYLTQTQITYTHISSSIGLTRTLLTCLVCRLLSNGVHKYILNPSYIPKVLKIARATLFPNNAPGLPRKVPDAIEIIEIKRKCAESIAAVLPETVGARYFGIPSGGVLNEACGENSGVTKEAIVDDVDGLLDVLGDAYMNKHLIFGILSLIVLRLAPELGTEGVGELMREKVPDIEDY
jgi:hypothetical protein